MPVAYQLKRSQRVSLIKIEIKNNAQVVVTAPYLIPEFIIKNFVQKQETWIKRNLLKSKKQQAQLKDDEVFIFDKKYQLQINDQASIMGIKLVDQSLIINNLTTKTPIKIKEQLTAFLKKTAFKYINTRVQILAKQMSVTYQRIVLREQSSRWGSCSSHGNLNFNWHLVHYPPAVIDYVIIHELAHRLELNHSKKFWAIVKQYDREYLIHKGQLRKRRYN